MLLWMDRWAPQPNQELDQWFSPFNPPTSLNALLLHFFRCFSFSSLFSFWLLCKPIGNSKMLATYVCMCCHLPGTFITIHRYIYDSLAISSQILRYIDWGLHFQRQNIEKHLRKFWSLLSWKRTGLIYKKPIYNGPYLKIVHNKPTFNS